MFPSKINILFDINKILGTACKIYYFDGYKAKTFKQ